MTDQTADEATTEAVPCVCGAQLTRPYPNDTGHHSTTECIDEAADEATTDLTAVLAAHERRSWSCACHAWAFQPETPNYGDHDARDAHAAHLADVLAPVIRAERAAALGEASADLFRNHDMPPNKDSRSYSFRMGWREGVHHAAKVTKSRAEAERRGES